MVWRRWIWVEDTATGHRYDVPVERLSALMAEGAVTPVDGYPPHEGPNVGPRPPKPRLDPTTLTPTAAPAPAREVRLSEPRRPRQPRKSTASVTSPADPITTTETERTEP